jgi:hypothetical protein
LLLQNWECRKIAFGVGDAVSEAETLYPSGGRRTLAETGWPQQRGGGFHP